MIVKIPKFMIKKAKICFESRAFQSHTSNVLLIFEAGGTSKHIFLKVTNVVEVILVLQVLRRSKLSFHWSMSRKEISFTQRQYKKSTN